MLSMEVICKLHSLPLEAAHKFPLSQFNNMKLLSMNKIPFAKDGNIAIFHFTILYCDI